ncbi:hypothetical protein LFM09_18855 [Lentzea alba]|uniref:hypothetical protein n=1 Tax=Lentzea alba TaxID=2714351 RepID=UPI0039BF72DC
MPEQLIRTSAPRPHAVVVLVIALVALLSGSAPQADARVVPPMFRMMYLPDDQDRSIAEARDSLIAACMAAHGHSYSVQVDDITEAEALAALRPFGLESLENLMPEPQPAEAVQGEDYARALFGDPGQRVKANGERLGMTLPATGCQADAERRLLGDQRLRALELRLRLYDGERDAREQLDRDPAFVAATERWRRCVSGFGVDARTPDELLSALSGDADLAAEPAVRADVRCKHVTGYLGTAYARLAACQQNWLDEHADLVAEWRALRQRQHAVAQRVL